MFDSALEALVLCTLTFSCLAQGGVSFTARTLIQAAVAAGCLLWIGVRCLRPAPGTFLRTGLAAPAALLALIPALQVLPLPLPLVSVLSPLTAALLKDVLPAGGAVPVGAISVQPALTMAEGRMLLAYLGLFFLTVHLLRTKRHVQVLLNGILLLGVGVSVFMMIRHFRLLGMGRLQSVLAFFTGPFVYRNTFASYINMIIPLGLGYCFTRMPAGLRVIYGVCVGIMALALFVSLSRAGIIVSFFTLAFFSALVLFKEQTRRADRLGILVFLAALYVLLFSLEASAALRAMKTLFNPAALSVLGHGYPWKDIIRIGADFPLLGVGLGCFESVSSWYKSLMAQDVFRYAHNDILQWFAETGIVGMAAWAWLSVRYAFRVLREWNARSDPFALFAGAGGIASVCSMGLYSFLDFNSHVPGNAALFCVICALLYRLVTTHYEHARPR